MALKTKPTPALAEALLKFDSMSQQDVERLITAAYRVRGYDVQVVKGLDRSEANDLLLIKEGHRLLLQCKYWKMRKVGEMPVRELYGAMAAHSATNGVMTSSGLFTLEAMRFANFGGIELLDPPKLKALLQRQPTAAAHSPPARSMAG